MQNQSLTDTQEFPQPELCESGAQTISSLVEVDLAGLSDQGKVRENNEDSFFIARFDRTMRALQTNLPSSEYPAVCGETSYGMVVADGVGGHAAGEVASRTAVLVLLNQVLKTPDWIMRLDDQLVGEVMRRTAKRLQEVQEALAKQAQANSNLSGMGTTLTMAWSLGADLLVAHVGDSRAYLMRQGQLRQLTHDQTFTQDMVNAGILTPEQASHHRLRHALTGVLSTSGAETYIEFRHLHLLDGDQILLCSDGLTEMVSETALAEVLCQTGPAAEACRTLVDLALEAGGKDNVTVVLARYSLPEPSGTN